MTYAITFSGFEGRAPAYLAAEDCIPHNFHPSRGQTQSAATPLERCRLARTWLGDGSIVDRILHG